jgi:CRISPR-associated protein Csm1
MSLQVFLQAGLFGAEEFLAANPFESQDSFNYFIGRCAWLNLLCEVVPRALLEQLKLSQMLLGSSSAEQFFLVLAEEDIPRANEFLTRCAREINLLSAGTVRLDWATTENLGSWPVARKRLDDALALTTCAPLALEQDPASAFAPIDSSGHAIDDAYFSAFGAQLQSAVSVGWDSNQPVRLLWDAGQYTWTLREPPATGEDGIVFPRRIATNDVGDLAQPLELAATADGACTWGMLVGAVDGLDVYIKSLATIEEHIQVSVLFKEFFAGELSLLCMLPEFWRKVTLCFRGGGKFVVVGAWDALLTLAREINRLFESFAQQHLQVGTALDGRTISAALAIAPEKDASPKIVFENAVDQLNRARSAEPGTFALFGRMLEWKRLSDAEELKSSLLRLVRDFGYSADYVHDLASVYREAAASRTSRRKAKGGDRPWRTYLRLAQVIPPARGKEVNNLRTAVIASLIGKRTASAKLRPSGRVGLEWARLAAETDTR